MGALDSRQRQHWPACSASGDITCLDAPRDKSQAVADDEVDSELYSKEFPADQIAAGFLRDTLSCQ